MELIKPIVRVGNSAGVLVPKDWLNGEARVTLVKKPQNIRQNTLEILNAYLPHIIGLYLVGSYARGEQTSTSDIDILGITDNINKKIKRANMRLY